jgi:hypothetical protein
MRKNNMTTSQYNSYQYNTPVPSASPPIIYYGPLPSAPPLEGLPENDNQEEKNSSPNQLVQGIYPPPNYSSYPPLNYSSPAQTLNFYNDNSQPSPYLFPEHPTGVSPQGQNRFNSFPIRKHNISLLRRVLCFGGSLSGSLIGKIWQAAKVSFKLLAVLIFVVTTLYLGTATVGLGAITVTAFSSGKILIGLGSGILTYWFGKMSLNSLEKTTIIFISAFRDFKAFLS